jgi:hypothetical protein
MATWYEMRVIEAGGGGLEFTCRRCGTSRIVVPRAGESPPETCPGCGLADDGAAGRPDRRA